MRRDLCDAEMSKRREGLDVTMTLFASRGPSRFTLVLRGQVPETPVVILTAKYARAGVVLPLTGAPSAAQPVLTTEPAHLCKRRPCPADGTVTIAPGHGRDSRSHVSTVCQEHG